jgi:glycosyltransferase involved in cell wall biosynthesis
MVLAPSASHAGAVRAVYGAGLPVETLYNAAALPSICTDARRPFVLAAGRWWDEGKNGHLLDAAAAASPLPVRIAGPLAGPGGQVAGFSHLEHCGDLSAWQMQELMADAAVFAAPSRYEPFGLAVLEAAAQGCALVLSDIPTFRELWDGAALFAPTDEPQAWTAAFGQLAREPALLRHLGGLARARAQHFSLARQTDSLVRLYLKLAGTLEEECA